MLYGKLLYMKLIHIKPTSKTHSYKFSMYKCTNMRYISRINRISSSSADYYEYMCSCIKNHTQLNLRNYYV